MNNLLTKSQREVLKIEVEEINEKLFNSFEFTSDQCWIKTKAPSYSDALWHVSDSIYGGVAGVILYILESYKEDKSANKLDILVKGINWLERRLVTEVSTSSFHTGNLGVAYVIIKVALFINDPKRIVGVIDTLKNIDRYSRPTDDLLNGTAGVILGLLKIHELVKEEFLLEEIDYYLKRLLAQVLITDDGISWDRNTDQIRGLCGLSHGAAGMAHLFFELGKYFNNSSYLWLANQAIEYESKQYLPNRQNWPDLRKGCSFNDKLKEECIEKYSNNDNDFFITPGNMSAWCHGAVGIGLSRIRAYDLSGEKRYLQDIKNSVTKTRKDLGNVSSVSLCHGLLGDIVLAANTYLKFKDRESLLLTRELVNALISFKQKYSRYGDGMKYRNIEGKDQGDDLSLFNGIAGVGYIVNYLIKPKVDLDIFLPILNNTCVKALGKYHYIAFQKDNMVSSLLSGYYPQSLKDNKSFINILAREYFQSELMHNCSENVCINDLDFFLESSKHNHEKSVTSWSHFGIFKHVEGLNAGSLLARSNQEILEGNYELSPYSKLTQYKEAKANNDSQYSYFLIFIGMSSLRGESTELNQLQHFILNCFKNSDIGKKVLEEVLLEFDIEESLIPEVRLFFMSFIKNSIKNLILIKSMPR